MTKFSCREKVDNPLSNNRISAAPKTFSRTSLVVIILFSRFAKKYRNYEKLTIRLVGPMCIGRLQPNTNKFKVSHLIR